MAARGAQTAAAALLYLYVQFRTALRVRQNDQAENEYACEPWLPDMPYTL